MIKLYQLLDKLYWKLRNFPRLSKLVSKLRSLAFQRCSTEQLHEAGEDCEREGCEECCGEFYGHEFDTSEGGYCLHCNANGYEHAAF